MSRNDVHSPKNIITTDYEFVVVRTHDQTGFNNNAPEIAIFNAHRKRTGAKFSDHEHGGSCMVCGAWMIDYAIFHHIPSNVYIRTGCDCAEHIEEGHNDAFRVVAQKRRAAKARVAKLATAFDVLEDAGILGYVETMFDSDNLEEVKGFDTVNPFKPVYNADDNGYDVQCEEFDKNASERFELGLLFGTEAANNLDMKTLKFNQGMFYNLIDMVRNLVKYGTWSDKQVNYARSLVEKLSSINELAFKRKAERELMTDAPSGKVQITGEVLSTKWVDGYYGSEFKMVVLDERNFKVWSTVPAKISDDVEKGSIVQFTATLTPSNDDATFAFAKRPSKAKVLQNES